MATKPPSVNEKLLDRQVAHQIGLLRLSRGVQRELAPILLNAYAELRIALGERLGRLAAEGIDPGPFTTARLAAQMRELWPMISEHHRKLGQKLEEQLKKLASYEVDFQGRLLEGAVPIRYSWIRPGPEMLEKLVTEVPYQGRRFPGHISDLAARQFVDVADPLRTGVIKGETVDQMIRSAVGTKKRPGSGLLLGRKRRNQIESVIRTSMNHVATSARDAMYRANSDIIKGWQYIAVLDSRTTLECGTLDSSVHPLGSGPFPPRHFSCRSTTTPVLKSAEELFGIGVDVEPKHRAALDGVVPAKLDYETWLRRQPEAVQVEVLGVRRTELFRSDPFFKLERFIDSRGRRLSLAELGTLESDLLASHR